MKALPTVSALMILAAAPVATLNAMPAYQLLTTPASNGFTSTGVGYNDLANKPTQSPIAVYNGTRFEFVQTNGSSSGAGGFGGSGGVQFTDPEPRWALEATNGGYGGGSFQPTTQYVIGNVGPVIPGASSLGETNGPALPVPEPSSSWFLLALALIPILKARGNRKTRAS
jgi:hypothetical protein